MVIQLATLLKTVLSH